MQPINYSFVKREVTTYICNTSPEYLFWYVILPILIIFIIGLIIAFKKQIKFKFFKFFSDRGYIRIYYRLENKKVISKLIKLDSFKNFVIGRGKDKKRYNLDSMYNFIFGYDKYNFPIFLYDNQFIIPLEISKKKITSQIRKQLKEDFNIEPSKDEISAVELKIDSKIYNTVYDKKLLSDLYASLRPSLFENKTVLYIIIGVSLLIFLYYTGYLEQIINYFVN